MKYVKLSSNVRLRSNNTHLSFVGEELTAAVKNILAVGSDAVDVVVRARELAVQKPARLVFHKLLEPIFVQLLILHVVVLVLFCKKKR